MADVASVVVLVGVFLAFFLLLVALRPSTRLRQWERTATGDADADVDITARPSATAGLLASPPHTRVFSLPTDPASRASPFRVASDELIL